MEREYASSLFELEGSAFSRRPGISRKTALRLSLHLLRRDQSEALALGESIIKMRKEITYCHCCHNISESELCDICSDPRRDKQTVCVVENVKDVICFERTGQFHGVYHVLGGLISPLDGIGPEQLEIDSLINRVIDGGVSEIILALSATMEGDTTNFYIYRRLGKLPVKVTQLARGVSVGNEIEYTDEITLGRSLLNRTDFNV